MRTRRPFPGPRIPPATLVLLLATASLAAGLVPAAHADFWQSIDWKDHKHKLKVCLRTPHCPPGMADSVQAAVDLWNAKHLTWQFTFDPNSCEGADIAIGCGNISVGSLGRWVQHYVSAGSGVYDSSTITIKMGGLTDWGWCDDKYEMVGVLVHELGHAARLRHTPSNQQENVMREEEKKAGHTRAPSPKDSTEAEHSDTATTQTTTPIPRGGQKQQVYSGQLIPKPGTWPFNFPHALNFNLRALDPAALQIFQAQPSGPDQLSWSAFVNTQDAEMEPFYLTIQYPESTSVREGLFFVTDTTWQPDWVPHPVAPNDTTVPYDTCQVLLNDSRSWHPAGDRVAYRWEIDRIMGVQGDAETSIDLPVGVHQVELVAEDQFGTEARDTMVVTVLATVGVGEGRPPGESLRFSFPVPLARRPDLPISYDLPAAAPVRLRIYDMGGRLVRTLVEAQSVPAGHRLVRWDLRDDRGRRVASGSYLCVLQVGETRVARKALILR